MAAKKKSTSKGLAPTRQRELASIDDIKEKLRARASEAKDYLGSGLDNARLSLDKDGEFKLGDASLGDSLDVVMLDFVNVRVYYDRIWNPKDPCGPACYSVGRAKAIDMEPARDAVHQQCATCADCEMDEYDSDPSGRGGKACKEKRRVMLSHGPDVALEEVITFEVPPTSLKKFDKYVRGLDKHGLSPYEVVTRMYVDEVDTEKKGYTVMGFEMVEEILDAEHLTNILEKQEEISEDIMRGFDPSSYVEKEDKPKRSKATGTKSKRAPRG